MTYEITVQMGDRSHFIGRLRALDAAGTATILDSGETATTVYAEVETQLSVPELREALQAEDFHDAVAFPARGSAGRR